MSLILILMLIAALWRVCVLQDRWMELCHALGCSSRTNWREVRDLAHKLRGLE